MKSYYLKIVFFQPVSGSPTLLIEKCRLWAKPAMRYPDSTLRKIIVRPKVHETKSFVMIIIEIINYMNRYEVYVHAWHLKYEVVSRTTLRVRDNAHMNTCE